MHHEHLIIAGWCFDFSNSFSYFVRVSIGRPYASDIRKELDFAVQNTAEEPEINNSIKMEVGIEDCLHIEFEYNKSKCVFFLCRDHSFIE